MNRFNRALINGCNRATAHLLVLGAFMLPTSASWFNLHLRVRRTAPTWEKFGLFLRFFRSTLYFSGRSLWRFDFSGRGFWIMKIQGQNMLMRISFSCCSRTLRLVINTTDVFSYPDEWGPVPSDSSRSSVLRVIVVIADNHKDGALMVEQSYKISLQPTLVWSLKVWGQPVITHSNNKTWTQSTWIFTFR